MWPLNCTAFTKLLNGIAIGVFVTFGACEPTTRSTNESSASTASGPLATDDKARQKQFNEMIHSANQLIRSEDYAAAGRIISQGLAETRAAGRDQELFTARFQTLFGNLKRMQSDPLEAMRQYADAMAVFRVHNNAAGQFEVLLELATLEEDRGDFAAAERQLTEAESFIKSIEDKKLLARLEVCRGRIDAARMNHSEAAKRFAEAASQFQLASDRLAQADTLMLQASSEDAAGDDRQSRATLEKANKIYTAENNNQGSVRAVHKLAALAEREGQIKKTRELLEQARTLYLALGKQSDAAKVEQHINALPQ